MRIALLAAATLLAAGAPLPAIEIPEAGLPVVRVLGGGPATDDCLASLEVVGPGVSTNATHVFCRDGDLRCDRDGLVNGRCEFWMRACAGGAARGCAARSVASLSVGGDLAEATILDRTAALLPKPAPAEGACGALTTVTVPLGERASGATRASRTRLTLAATAADGARDTNAITVVCRPPERERRHDQITFRLLQKRVFERSCTF